MVAGVTRIDATNTWWEVDGFRDTLVSAGIPVLKRHELERIDYDIMCSFTYGFLIESELINRAQFAVNLHESPLPRYRGCNGYSHAILEGDTTYGTTLHVMEASLDSGPIIDQEVFPIFPNETSKELYVRTAFTSTDILKRNLPNMATLSMTTRDIDVSSEPIHPRNSLETLKILQPEDFSDADAFSRKIRAFDFAPFEPAYLDTTAGRVYFFTNGSLGRIYLDTKQMRHLPFASLNPYVNTDTICIDGFPREIIAMPRAEYATRFRVFSPGDRHTAVIS